jgi:hypothetical protein
MSNLLTRASPLFLIAFIFIFTLFILYYVFPSYIHIPSSEAFAVAPTRASDCRCLPGYIPSNSVSSSYGGEFQHFNGTIAFVPFRSNQKHWVPQCSMCGINVCTPSVFKNVNSATWNKTSFGAQYTCSILKQAQEKANTQSTFFCQSSSDTSKTMSCY